LNHNRIEEILDHFIKGVQAVDKDYSLYESEPITKKDQISKKIGVQLNKYKDIVLESDTGLELGGINKKSFSLIYPVKSVNGKAGKNNIIIIGPEVKQLDTSNINFGLFILFKMKELSNKSYENLRNLSFISNGIEGFAIRSIPRRFWCRINKNVIKKGFSFQFLGNAIAYLYQQQFGNIIEALKILIISTYPELIDKFLEDTVKIRAELNNRWKEKVDNWKKRIDCTYEWACEICPYFTSCKSLQDVLKQRKDLEI
jgi:CO dehydrogenase/acetyl-CoA synthase beta subunit